MSEINKYLLIYLILINLVSFIYYGIDKLKAINQTHRIPERRLLLIAAIGGSLGALLGMKVFHHKTRKKIFSHGIPAFILIQISFFLFAIHIVQ